MFGGLMSMMSESSCSKLFGRLGSIVLVRIG